MDGTETKSDQIFIRSIFIAGAAFIILMFIVVYSKGDSSMLPFLEDLRNSSEPVSDT